MFLLADIPQCDNRQSATAYLPRSGTFYLRNRDNEDLTRDRLIA